MSSFTVNGLSTGIDYNELIGKLMEVQRQPIKILESKKTSYNNKVSSYGELSTKLAALKSAADKLKTSYNFYVKTASVSDEAVLDATPSGITSAGNYSVIVSTLASEEKEVHSGVASSSTVINDSGSDKVFQYTYAGTQRSLTVATGKTLDGLKNLINEDTSNPGVTATIVNDGTNSRLIITGDESGSTNTITIDAGTTLDGTGSTSDFRSSTFSQNKAAANASFSVDGLSITRSSNTFSDVIEGMTITLKEDGEATSKISVSADTDSIKQQINDFVDAYNDVAGFISTNTAYDSTTRKGGILSGEGTARNIQNKLRSLISDEVSGLTGGLTLLAQIGITTDSNTGKLEVDGTTLDSKLGSNLDDLADLFKSSDGVATTIYDYITSITSTVDGSITIRKKGLGDIIENIDDTITRMEYRLDKTEADMTKKFTALEMLVSSFNTVGNYLSNFSAKA